MFIKASTSLFYSNPFPCCFAADGPSYLHIPPPPHPINHLANRIIPNCPEPLPKHLGGAIRFPHRPPKMPPPSRAVDGRGPRALAGFPYSQHVEDLIREFDCQVPIEEAMTPPSAWYTNPAVLSHEMDRVFGRGWLVVGHFAQIEKPCDYFTGSLGRIQYVVCRDERGDLHAFHNVCRHHAAPIASGSGCKSCFVCPYHGWTYDLNGKFKKATRLSGIRNFIPSDNGLLPIRVASWGPFLLINLESPFSEKKEKKVGLEWLRNASELLASATIDKSLCHVARREYIINCNWKVYCDNYLDGGYHVPFAHGHLAGSLDLDSYSTKLFETVSIQSCKTGVGDIMGRLGSMALYAFVYPNFMINRYGPWMDTNLVLPITTSQCRVIFDYFLDPSVEGDKHFIEQSLQDSELVQVEDIRLCEGVQMGLESQAFNKGRYAPKVEMAMHHFHSLLQKAMLEAN